MKSSELTKGALIGALYIVLTIAFQPISSGLIQVRISEALCVLPFFTGSAVPGLFLGCLTANLITGAPVHDVIFGSLATLLAACAAYGMKKNGWSRFLIPLPSVIFNALIVGWLLNSVYQVGVPFYVCALYVGLGQTIACYVLGIPLMALLEKYREKLF